MFRRGSTLMEVLIAIFVMGIGLMSVLALFPMGAIKMAQAIQDDRAGHAFANAKAIAVAQNIRFDPNVVDLFNTAPSGAFDPPGLDGPSFAVYVDPFGYSSYSLGRSRLGGGGGGGGEDGNNSGGGTGIHRATLSFVAGAAQSQADVKPVLRWCTLTDDITFGPNGQPSRDSGATDRQSSVSWAWLLRRPKVGTPAYCELTVVIYNQRPLTTAVPLAAKEQAYSNCPVGVANGQVTGQMNLVTLRWGPSQPIPRVLQGGWILDATPNGRAPCNAAFYRVVSVGDPDLAHRIMEIELEKPMRGLTPGQNATIVILDGVIEVQECGAAWSAWNN